MKIGIFPGSFDPLHQSHIKIIKLSFIQLKLDKLFLIPIINPRKNQNPVELRIKLLKSFFSENKKISVLSYKRLDYWNFIDDFIRKKQKHNFYRLMGETCYNSYPEVGKLPLRDEPDTLTEILRNQAVVIMPNPANIHKILKAKTLDMHETKKIIILDIKNEENYMSISSITQKIKKDPIMGLKELKYNKYYRSSKSLNFVDWEKMYWPKTILRIGISHGTFDNPHEGHLKLWGMAKKQLKLDCVFVWPSFCPYHKLNCKSFEERYNLLEEKLAFHTHIHLLTSVKDFAVSKDKTKKNMEKDVIRNILKSHEIIVDWLTSQLPPLTKYYRLFGADSFLEYLNKYGNGLRTENPLNTMLKKGNIAVLERDGSLLPSELPSGVIKLKPDKDSLYFYRLSNTKINDIKKEFGIMKVRNTESKHIPQNITTKKMRLLDSYAKKVGYKYSRIGIHKKNSQSEDIKKVRQLATYSNFRPVKFVITKDGKIWADNSHWALASLIRHGQNTLVNDIPHYFVDLRMTSPLVINKPESLKMPQLKIAVEYAQEIQQRIDKGWRPKHIKYTIGELFKEGGYI